MENGEIAGFGNFAELQKNHKNFASLFQITNPTSIDQPFDS
jgi:ABC-type multidrug transport system fused ATPase/permease subunit